MSFRESACRPYHRLGSSGTPTCNPAPYATCYRANLQNANLQGQNLAWINFTYENLAGAQLQNAILTNTQPNSADLQGINAASSYSTFYGGFTCADLTNANLNYAQLRLDSFQKGIARNATLEHANLHGA
ncbi:MAG: pentapeptide repeat-containing protein [Nitrososphaerales archaeon]